MDVATAKRVVRQKAHYLLVWTDFGWARITKREMLEILGQGKTDKVIIKRSTHNTGTYCFNAP